MLAQLNTTLWLLRIEGKLVWRQQKRSLGRIAALFSPVGAMLLYALLHGGFGAIYVLLPIKLSLADMPNISGNSLILLAVTMFSLALPACIAMLAERKDWDLILGSPISLFPVLTARMIGIAAQIVMFPAFLLTPLFNIAAFSGRPTLFLIYPSLAVISLGGTALAMTLVIGVIRKLGLKQARTFAKFAGIIMAILFLTLSQIQHSIESLGAVLSSFHATWFFKQCNWLGEALFGNGAALLILASLIIILFVGATFLMRPALAHVTSQATDPAHNGKNPKVQFRMLAWEVAYKEWCLVFRDTRFFMLFLRLIILLGTVLSLLYQTDTAAYLFALGPIIVFACAIITNDLTWLMIIAEQVPELLMMSPVGMRRLVIYKALSAVLPIMLILIGLASGLLMQDTKGALVTLLLGFFAITTTAAINIFFAIKIRKKLSLETRSTNQNGLIVFLQGTNILFWAFAVYGLKQV